MQAIVFNEVGKPEEVLQVVEKEKPVPGDDEVLLKVLANPLNPSRAWGLLDTAQPIAGEWMLLTGANSSVSQIVIQLARQQGVRIIALVRDLAQAPGLRSLGAEEVFDIDDPHLSDHIQRLTG